MCKLFAIFLTFSFFRQKFAYSSTLWRRSLLQVQNCIRTFNQKRFFLNELYWNRYFSDPGRSRELPFRFRFGARLPAQFTSRHFTSLHFACFTSLHFTSPPLTSLTSLHFTSLHLNSFHSLHLTSLHFTSILLTPTGPGAQNRYFSKGFYIKNDTFSVPAAPGRLPRPAPALKTVIFQKDFKQKTILFQSRPLRATCSDRPWRSKRFPARV